MESLPRRLARRLVREWEDYHVSQSAAAVAFHTLLSLAPVLVFATAAATAFLSRDEAQQLVKEQLAETVGPGAAEVAGTVLHSEGFQSGGLIATTSSGVLLPFGSSAVFVQLRRTLDRIFGGGPTGETPYLLRFLLGRLFSTAFAIVGGLFLVATLLRSAVFNSVADRLALLTGTPTAWWAQFSQALSFGAVAIVLLALLAWLPSRPPPLRWVLVGMGLSTALFELGKWVASRLLASTVIASAYGPSSSLVVLLLWVYYSTHIILLGAVLSHALAAEVDRDNPDG